MAADVAAFITEHNLKDTVLIGHSMGGKVAMDLAFQQPFTIGQLIVVDIAPKYYPVHHQTILKALNSIDIGSLASRQEAEDILAQDIPEWPIRQFLLKNLGRDGQAFRWKMNLPVITDKIENVGEALPNGHSIDIPTLFIRGSKSNYILDEDSGPIHHAFSDAIIHTIEGAGHWVHAEKPDELISVIKNFITN